MAKFTSQKLNGMVTLVEVHLDNDENEFHIYNSPDNHWDNPKCDRELMKEHFDEAKKMGAAIVMPGDTFCLMQGAYDPRKSKSDIRPEHNVSKYLDAVIDDAADWYSPYKDNIVAIGLGNHETAILKRNETHVLERFAGKLGGNAQVMGYHGWVVFRFFKSGQRRWDYRLYFRHGSGGGGPVTRGQIEFSRNMMHIEGADCISMGHIHEKNAGEVIAHYFCQNTMKAKGRSVINLRASTYKQEFNNSGFQVEKGGHPKPLGGSFVSLYFSRERLSNTFVAEARIRTGKGFDIT